MRHLKTDRTDKEGWRSYAFHGTQDIWVKNLHSEGVPLQVRIYRWGSKEYVPTIETNPVTELTHVGTLREAKDLAIETAKALSGEQIIFNEESFSL
jgi:hypothetical protein